jgi:peptidyl-tRNA hydrolase
MPPKERRAEFVLSPFESREESIAKEMTARAADAVLEFAAGGIAQAMNRFNRKLRQPEEG